MLYPSVNAESSTSLGTALIKLVNRKTAIGILNER